MTEIEIKNKLDPLLKDLATFKTLEAAEIVISELMKLLGVTTSERKLLNIPKVDTEIHRFQPAPSFLKQAAAFEIPSDKNVFLDLKLYWLKKVTKTNLSWVVGLTPNFEDSAANDFENIGIDFVVPENGDSLIILLSHQYKIRSLEIKDYITSTQAEIFRSWNTFIFSTEQDSTTSKSIAHSKLWESFNFEPINKKFYLELVESFSLLVSHLEKDFGKKPSVMFTTRLIGRMLFIWFLKKKNLINNEIDYFKVSSFQNQNDFYKNSLEVLFFNVLNQEIALRSNEDIFTPYLNGGLFDINQTDFYQDSNLTFPNGFFNNLFNTLNKYNFTVDESSPEFQHVAIDPEMLGRIFESLLAEQIDETTGNDKKKQTGAFYTPREIVSYMCEESLIQFLKTKVPYTPDRDKRIEELIRLPEAIFRDQDSNKRRDWKPYSESIIKALSGSETNSPIMVLDPAVGSGAFPMGMLHLLVKVFSRLDVKYEKNIFNLKRDILSKSLYGVDIEQTAIEICRLRAWLSIIVDIEENTSVQPLPNLDFKFVCANTLVPLSETKQESLLNDPNLKDKLMVIRDKYFNTINKAEKIKLQNEYLKLTHNEDLFDDHKTKQLKSYQPFKVDSSSNFYDPELHHGVKLFDIIIGNPPYVRQENFKDFKPFLKENYKVFNSKSDLLTYFIEKGFNSLSQNGTLNFIISNKFTRSDYGKTIREFLSKNTQLLQFIDFEGILIFDTATVDSSIIFFEKTKPRENSCLKYLNYKKNNTKNIKLTLNEILKLNLIEYKNSNLSSASWTFEDSSVSLIKEKIVSQGIPLSKWDIKIYRGILTGLNEAFVINNEIKDQLILEDPNCEKIIKPLLRGRDIEKYKINYSNLWLISTFPSLNINIDKYPSIKKHLASFGKKIEQSGEKGSRKKTSGQWFEIQDSIAYWSEFDKPKIIYPNMTKYMPFYYDDKGFYTNQKCFILTGKHIEYLTCFLNSNVFKFCFKDNFPLLLGGTRELSKVFFEKISIKPISDDLNNQFKSLLNLVQSAKQNDNNTDQIESKINDLICKHYQIEDISIFTDQN